MSAISSSSPINSAALPVPATSSSFSTPIINSSPSKPIIDWNVFQEKIPTKKVTVQNYDSVVEAFKNLKKLAQDEINRELQMTPKKGARYVFLKGITPRPLFVTQTDIFIIFDRQKKQFGDVRIGNGAFKNFYHAVNLTSGKVRGFYSSKGNAQENVQEIKIAKITKCGPKIYGRAQKVSKHIKSNKTKICAVVKLYDQDLEKALKDKKITISSMDDAIDLVKKLLDQNALFHSGNYINRDIKFTNFLVNYKKNNGYDIKITDFGFSIPKNTVGVKLFGTRLFMCPQSPIHAITKAQFAMPADETTDSWALAMSCVEWIVLSKLPLFDGFFNDSVLCKEFIDKFIDSSATGTSQDHTAFMKELNKSGENLMIEPEKSDTLKFVLSNLLQTNRKLRWTPEQALKFLSNPPTKELIECVPHQPLPVCPLQSPTTYLGVKPPAPRN